MEDEDVRLWSAQVDGTFPRRDDYAGAGVPPRIRVRGWTRAKRRSPLEREHLPLARPPPVHRTLVIRHKGSHSPKLEHVSSGHALSDPRTAGGKCHLPHAQGMQPPRIRV